MKQPTQDRAAKIAMLTGLASSQIITAEHRLSEALKLAHDDYDHNDDKLRDLVGAIRLVASGVATEYQAWDGYAQARKGK